MQIQVRLIGLFKSGRFGEQVRSYPAGSLVADVVSDLDLPREHLGIVLINDLHADLESPLNDGDRLTLLPLLDGG